MLLGVSISLSFYLTDEKFLLSLPPSFLYLILPVSSHITLSLYLHPLNGNAYSISHSLRDLCFLPLEHSFLLSFAEFVKYSIVILCFMDNNHLQMNVYSILLVLNYFIQDDHF